MEEAGRRLVVWNLKGMLRLMMMMGGVVEVVMVVVVVMAVVVLILGMENES